MFDPKRLLLAAAAVAAVNVALGSHRASAAPAEAEAATAPDAAAAADGALMTVVVAEVKGLVQVRTAEGQPWQKATAGMELTEGAEFRTGPKSSVTCQIPPDQTIVLDRLGTVRVAEAIRRGGTVRTDLIMKYGRTQYEIEAAGAQHESTIRSPSSTLAVRGTAVSLYDQPPFVPQARSFTGRATYLNAKRQLGLGAPGRGARIRADRDDAADSALAESVVDPSIAGARTGSENQFIETEVSRGALFQSGADIVFAESSTIGILRNTPPQKDTDLAANLPGRLNFVLRWGGNADLDLQVGEQAIPAAQQFASLGTFFPDEILAPGGGLNRNLTGGRIDVDHQGGPSGGQEIAYWPGSFPEGIYGLTAVLVSGEPTDFTFNAFLDGDAINTFAFDLNGGVGKGKTIRRTLSPELGFEVGIVFVPPNAEAEENFAEEPGSEFPAADRTDGGNGGNGDTTTTLRLASAGRAQPRQVSAAAAAFTGPVQLTDRQAKEMRRAEKRIREAERKAQAKVLSSERAAIKAAERARTKAKRAQRAEQKRLERSQKRK